MIPKRAIEEWHEFYPWKLMAFVEQDLIICRALCALYNDDYLSEHLAFRGGTALHKLYLQPQSRYSKDIDLVQIDA
jgi:predicted nucleotidyltransferase component of viral defense system